MAKTIKLNYEGREYTLEYTRKTVSEMEQSGFNIDELATKPASLLPLLFAGAFRAHHRYIKAETVEAIFDHIGKKDDLIIRLAEMYAEPINALMAEPEEEDEGKNANWSANW